MSEKQKEALERITAALEKLPDEKKEYLIGYADALDDMRRKRVEELQEDVEKEAV